MPLIPPFLKPRSSFGVVTTVLSLLGLVALGFVSGAAVMDFRLPPSDFFRKAFAEARSSLRRSGDRDARPPTGDVSRGGVSIDKLNTTFDGFTLVSNNQLPRAILVNMRGQPVHRWALPSPRPWPRAEGVRDPLPQEIHHWERCHLFPNGDLLALCCLEQNPFGYGLVKLDKDSRVLWGFSDSVHHSFDVAEDGRIYVLTNAIEDYPNPPPSVLVNDTPPTLYADYLVVLSAEGKELERVSLMKAFRASPFSLLLPGSTPAHPSVNSEVTDHYSGRPHDLLHANSVRVLSQEKGKQFPLFAPGQVLLSLRSPHALAVLDIEKRSIVWAARGVWQAQHDAQFLDNGRLLLFDNLGQSRGARVLEYDPRYQAVPWWWGGDRSTAISCNIRGGVQRLANGNTLLVDSVGRQVLEVTEGKEVVWRWHCPVPFIDDEITHLFNVTGATRFGADELTFLKGSPQAQPR